MDRLTCFFAGLVIMAAAAALFFWCRQRRLKEELKDMQEILGDIRDGNGNRRILIPEGRMLSAPAYQMNEIVCGYEERLERLKRTEEANKQLMTSLSHDIRTPLTTLIGYLDAVRRGTAEGEEREEYIDIADRKAHDLKEYVDILFDWFKLNSDEYALVMQPEELAEMTRNLLKDWIPVFEEQGMAYEIAIPMQPLMCLVDRDAYSRILNNLIQNVLSHSRADCIGISLRGGREAVELCVWDNGVGIEEKDLAHIFERLYKCDKARSEKGSGLGLSIVRQIAGKMGGSISAASQPGIRTAFTVRFKISV